MSKTILIYYSYTGNTKIIAEKIRNKIKCDVLELIPKTPFRIEDYDKLVEEYQSNENDKTTVEIEDINVNLNDYQNVIIGTSVWWYSITPVVRKFLMKNDLSNKNVYVYATNGGWLGRTFKEIKSLVKGNIKEELDIRFAENWAEHKYLIDENELEEFINKIN